MFPNGPEIKFKYPVTMPWSVIIPLHKWRHEINRCLCSVVSQAFSGMEIIVADHRDCKDHEKEMAYWMDFGVKWVHPKPTGSMAADWNVALSYASGEWTHLLHDDDHVSGGFYIPRLGDISWSSYINTVKGMVSLYRNEMPKSVQHHLKLANPFHPVAVTVKREVYEMIGGYLENPKLYHGADWEFYLRTTLVNTGRHPPSGFVWTHAKETLAVYTDDEESQSKGSPQKRADAFNSIYEVIRYFESNGLDIGCCAAASRAYSELASREAKLTSNQPLAEVSNKLLNMYGSKT